VGNNGISLYWIFGISPGQEVVQHKMDSILMDSGVLDSISHRHFVTFLVFGSYSSRNSGLETFGRIK
jgi:hypothetical protein